MRFSHFVVSLFSDVFRLPKLEHCVSCACVFLENDFIGGVGGKYSPKALIADIKEDSSLLA